MPYRLIRLIIRMTHRKISHFPIYGQSAPASAYPITLYSINFYSNVFKKARNHLCLYTESSVFLEPDEIKYTYISIPTLSLLTEHSIFNSQPSKPQYLATRTKLSATCSNFSRDSKTFSSINIPGLNSTMNVPKKYNFF